MNFEPLLIVYLPLVFLEVKSILSSILLDIDIALSLQRSVYEVAIGLTRQQTPS